jgi:hypothetical protein
MVHTGAPSLSLSPCLPLERSKLRLDPSPSSTKMKKFLVLGALPVLALAAQSHPSYLFRRTDDNYAEIGDHKCEENDLQQCGDGCIPISYECCPDLKGGCPATDYCSLGDNGVYGCCEDGEVCSGDGGASTSTIFGKAPTSTWDTEYTPSASPTDICFEKVQHSAEASATRKQCHTLQATC